MDSDYKFDKLGRVIPNNNVRRKFFERAQNGMFTNTNRGALMVVRDVENNDAYLAAFDKLSFYEFGDDDMYRIIRNYGEEAYWVRPYLCAFVHESIYDYLQEAFPKLRYVRGSHIISQ